MHDGSASKAAHQLAFDDTRDLQAGVQLTG